MNISAGRDVPKDIHVIIEIPMESDPVKYEVDKKTGALFVDRFLTTPMYYPCNYGYVPNTLSEDGDPVDVLVITPTPLLPASVIRSRPIGILKMQDESGVDAKILAVPHDKTCLLYQHVHSPQDVSPHLLNAITHFFEHYKDLEPDKWVKVEGWYGTDEAYAEILASAERYHQQNQTVY